MTRPSLAFGPYFPCNLIRSLVTAVLVISSFSQLSHFLRSVHTHIPHMPSLFLTYSCLPPHCLANFYFSFKSQSKCYLLEVFSDCHRIKRIPLYFIVPCTMLRRRQWHPTPVLLPGKSHGRRSLEGCSPWGR